MPQVITQHLRNLLHTEDAFATTMVALLIDDFGTEALTWTPKTIIMELETIHGVVPKQGNIDRLMAAVYLLTSNSFYISLPDFNDICNILSGDLATPGMFQPADAAACAWGITEAMLLAPPDDEDEAFTEEIAAYVGEALSREGIINPPDVLRIAHYDKELQSKIHAEYSDDPIMFSAIYKSEQSKTDEINDYIKKRLQALVLQLDELPLKNGSTKQVVQLMLNSLPEEKTEEINIDV